MNLNSSRTLSQGGYSRGRKLGPSASTRSFTLTQGESITNKTNYSSSLPTHQVGWTGSNAFADASQTLEVMQAVADEYGRHTPIVWCDTISSEPSSGTSCVVQLYGDRTVYGFLDLDTIDISVSGRWGNEEIQSLSQVSIQGIV